MGGRFRKRFSAKLRPVAAVLFRLSAQPSEVRALGFGEAKRADLYIIYKPSARLTAILSFIL